MKIRDITIMGTAVALIVVLSRFLSFVVPLFGFPATKISLGFIVVFFISTQFKPIYGGVVDAMADIVGSIAFPIGPYFPGFTLTSLIAGTMVGYLFNFFNKKSNKDVSLLACLISISVSMLFITFLNTFWVRVLYSTPFFTLLIPRVISSIMTIAVLVPMSFFFLKIIQKYSVIKNNK